MSVEDEPERIEVELLLEAIKRRYGYDLAQYVPGSMVRRVRAALARSGLEHLGNVQHRLLHDPEWFSSLLDQLTVQVSEMFRDPGFYRFFRERVVPLLRTYPELRFWHAGCSSGEEVYASAILLEEAGLYDRTQIYATDLSARAVALAKEGVYAANVATSFGNNYERSGGSARFSDYYSVAYGRIAMRDALKRNIVFFQHNLTQDHAIGEMNVIFCRNVLFYFEKGPRRRVLEVLANSLCRGGFLCLGATESAPDLAAGTLVELAPGERIFRRVGVA